MLHIDEVDYLRGIYGEIARVRERGGTGVYRVNAEITSKIARYIQQEFSGKPGYMVEVKRCRKCQNTYDIIITFSNTEVTLDNARKM